MFFGQESLRYLAAMINVARKIRWHAVRESTWGKSELRSATDGVVKHTSDVFGQPWAKTFQINESGKESRDMNVRSVNLHRDECFQTRQTRTVQGVQS